MFFKSANQALLVAAAYLAGLVVADNCLHNTYYCGKSLMRKGDYLVDISNSLSNAGQEDDLQNERESLFLCKDDDDIPFQQYCTYGCGIGPSDGNDYCCEDGENDCQIDP